MPSGRPSETVKSGVIAALAAVALLWSSAVAAHDASAWGGLFRSRDHGATWFLASPGTYPTAAIALAVSPTDHNHLLLATDTGLLRSRNGGRDRGRRAPHREGRAPLAPPPARGGRPPPPAAGPPALLGDGGRRRGARGRRRRRDAALGGARQPAAEER